MLFWTADTVVAELTRRGELWEPVPGLAACRGGVLALFRRIETRLADLARAEGFDEWQVAPGLELQTLARARYFESFPQWLTAAGHLGDDEATLDSIARSPDPAAAAGRAIGPAACALTPALCYHTYARLSGETVEAVRMTTQGTCWRHEGDRLRPLERGWAFTMREMVFVGAAADVRAFRQAGMALGLRLARSLGLSGDLQTATDPFFAPSAKGRALLQQVKGLKHELRLDVGGGRRVAAASFNDHERFFGTCFDIRQPHGEPAASGCIAFGLERWVLAFLVAHGPDPAAWPDVDAARPVLERTLT